MKFTCHKDTILKEIMIASKVISTKDSYKILSNVFLELQGNSLIIKSTDLKLGYITQIPVKTIEEGSVTVFCDKLLAILQKLKDFTEEEIMFEKKDNKFYLYCKNKNKNITFYLKLLTDNNFPELKNSNNNITFTIDQQSFIEMINQTIFSISNDDTRIFMNGVYLKKEDNNLVMVATDGRRLSFIKKEIMSINSFEPIIVPPRILNLLKELGSSKELLEVTIFEKYIFFNFEGKLLYSSLIDLKFPDYKSVIPSDTENSLTMNKKDLIKALDIISVMVENKSRKIYLNVENNNIYINSDNEDFGNGEICFDCKLNKEKTKIALNYTYLLDPLKVIDTDEIILNFNEEDKAMVINSVPASNYFHVIMPMNLN